MILEADELDALGLEVAEIFAETMPDRMSVQRTSEVTRDPEHPDSWTENANWVYENVPCRYRAALPTEKYLFGKPATLQAITIECATIFHIFESDSGKILAKGNQPEINFEVIGVGRESNSVTRTVVAEVV